MAKKEISQLEDYRKLAPKELVAKLNTLKAEYQTLRNEIAMSKSRDIAKSKKLRLSVARISTVLQEKMILSQLENTNGEA